MTIMDFLKLLIVGTVVCGILDLLTVRATKKSISSLTHFTVRAPIDFAFLGTIGMALCIGIFLFAKHENRSIPLLVMLILTIGLILPSALLMIAPIKYVWDVIVENDDITIIKGFIYRRHWKFSSIQYAKAGRGGLKVYVHSRKRKAFFVDTMCPASQNFIERMEKENKPIIYPQEDKTN
ncbi:hypothetical protein KWV05_17615 [Clostridioides difficile]|nr:hypothetical protein [Clostridioides difficile]HBG1767761.1 hypothetical protein [Clostridioides difficile]